MNVSVLHKGAYPLCLRALCLTALGLSLLPLRMAAQSEPPVVSGRIGPDGKVQVDGAQPGTAVKPGAPPSKATGPATLAAKKAEAQFGLAVSRQKQNKPAEALAAYEEFIRQVKAGALPPKQLLPAYQNMVILYRQRDDRKGMETTLRQIVALTPEAGAYADLASIEATQQRFAEAGRDAERALQLKPAQIVSASAHFVLGAVALQKRELGRAENECATAVRLAPGNAGAHYYYALTLFEEKKWPLALAQATQARQLAPGMVQASLVIAAVKRQMQDPQGALAAYDEALRAAPRNPIALAARAQLLVQMGRVNEAFSAYQQEVSLYPQDPEANIGLGRLYYNRQNYVQAAQRFEIAHSILSKRSPHDNRALISLAQAEAYLAAGTLEPRERAARFGKAESHLKEALMRDPKDTRLLFQLADLYRRSSRYDEAIATYRKRLVMAPDERDSYYGIANVYVMQLHPDDAIATWKSYQRRRPEDPVSYEQVARLLASQGKWADAVQEYQLLIARNPQDGNAHLALAHAYLELKQPDKAEPEFKTVLTYDPTANDKPASERLAVGSDRQAWRLAAWRGLAGIEEERGHISDAISYLSRVKIEEAALAKKEDKQPKPEVYIEIARLYQLDKQPDKALQELTTLTQVAPDDPAGFAALGAQYDARGNTEEAVAALRKASQRSKDPLEDALKAADVYRRHGSIAQCIAEYERMQPKYPGDPRLLSPLAQTLELTGKDESALKVYAALLKANPDLHWVEDRQSIILTRLHRYEEARALRVKLIARSPQERQGYADLARLYEMQGKQDEYLAWLKTRVENSPTESALIHALIDETARRQKAEEGWAFLHGVMSRHQNDRQALDAYYETLASSGRNSDAAEVKGRLAALDPKNLDAQTEYADSLAACGRKDDAARVFLQQIDRTDISAAERAQLRQMWAQRLDEQGKTADAIVQYRALIKVQPQNYEAISALIRLLKAAGQWDALIAVCTDLLKQPGYPPALRIQLLDMAGEAYEQQHNPAAARLQFRQALQISIKDRAALEGLKRIGEN